MNTIILKAEYSGSTSLSTAYASATLTVPDRGKSTGRLGGLFLFVDTISSATTLQVKITSDSAGDFAIVPELATAASIVIGQTTNTDGSVVISYDRIPYLGAGALYVWVKTDAGTATLNSATLCLEIED